MKRYLKLIILTILFLSISYNFSASQNNQIDYFPLKVGNFWLYKYGKTSTIDRRITDFDSLNNIYILKKIDKLGDLNPAISIFIYKKSNSKLLLLDILSIFGSSIRWKKNPEIILDYPLEIGKTWIEYNENDEKKVNQIIAFVNCNVKAGFFKNVCKIKFTISYKYKSKFEKLEGYDYYAPNIGLIKQETLYEDEAGTFMELIDYYIN